MGKHIMNFKSNQPDLPNFHDFFVSNYLQEKTSNTWEPIQKKAPWGMGHGALAKAFELCEVN